MIKIPIFFSSDNNYAPFVACTIASICDNTKSFCEFYVLDGGITKENKEKICELKKRFNNFSVEFIYVDLGKFFGDFPEMTNITKAAYSRFLIPELKPQLAKALYMDVDIIALGDIWELYQTNLQDKAVGCVEDVGTAEYISEFKNKYNITKYFNSGVLLLDLAKFHLNINLNKIYDIGIEKIKNFEYVDQDLLNILLKDDCVFLCSKYNCQSPAGENNIILRHFISISKPWKVNFYKYKNTFMPLANFDDFWKYAKITPFYGELKENYEKNINSSILNKRLSAMAEKQKTGLK